MPLVRGWLGDCLAWQAFVRQQRLWKDPANVGVLQPPPVFLLLAHHPLFTNCIRPALHDDMKAATAAHPAFRLMWDTYRASDARAFSGRPAQPGLGVLFAGHPDGQGRYYLHGPFPGGPGPLLDHHFLEFAARIPADLKLRNGQVSKYIFKKAAEPFLPHEVIYRPKMGFGCPPTTGSATNSRKW
jgi:hypothetical protein